MCKGMLIKLGCLYGRTKQRTVNLDGKRSSEVNSVGPKTPKWIESFSSGPLPVISSSPLIRLQRPIPSQDGFGSSEITGFTIENIFKIGRNWSRILIEVFQCRLTWSYILVTSQLNFLVKLIKS